jgi:hypothetical protein
VGQQQEPVDATGVGRVDAGGRHDRAAACLDDAGQAVTGHALGHHAHRLGLDDGGLVGRISPQPKGFRHDLAGQHDDVAVGQLDTGVRAALQQQSHEVVIGADLGDPVDPRDDQ